MILDLLKGGDSVFIVESDAMWLKDPGVYLERYSNCDFVAGNDRVTKVKQAECGFIFLNNTVGIIDLWTELYVKLQQNWELMNQGNSGVSKIVRAKRLGRLNEMVLFNNLLSENRVKNGGGKLSECWFPISDFPNGLWYQGKVVSDDPVVIQNNYIKGNDRKIERAKKFGHWFLGEEDECMIRK